VKPPRTERLVIRGPAGDLEAVVQTPLAEAPTSAGPAAFGVVCHPHPLYGGTLDNKVVYTLARAFEECGAPVVRFNFRGVGSSSGRFDEGRGESEDTLAAIAYGRARWPGAALWLGGFSFGAAVAVRAAEYAAPARMVLVAPGVTRVPMQGVPAPQCPWMLIQGDADEVIEPQDVLEWAAHQSPAPQLSTFSGAGHFFHGRLHELRAEVVRYMSAAAPAVSCA
jgi:alpha/beta superfamily hydrolase